MAIRPNSLPSDLSTVGETDYNVGSQVAPAAGTPIASTGALSGGVYLIRVQAGYGATADAADNMQLDIGNGRRTLTLYVSPVANGAPVEIVLDRVLVRSGEKVAVKNIAGGVAGSVYIARVSATPLPLAS